MLDLLLQEAIRVTKESQALHALAIAAMPALIAQLEPVAADTAKLLAMLEEASALNLSIAKLVLDINP